jgi:hypothetical protein
MAASSNRPRVSALQSVVSSPKLNRYLPWVAGLVLLAGVIAFIGVHYSNTAPANPNEKLSNKPATQEPSLGKAISLPKEARSVAARFVDAAVRGKSATIAWQLSGPEIRQGYRSLAQWKRDWNNPNVGVPIAPYPAAKNAQLKIDYARQREIQLKMYLTPVAGSNQRPQTFLMVLDRIGRGPQAPWKVNSWQTYSPPAIPAP